MSKECNKRNIPLPTQREVRQRCGFGCVICGLPLYHYHHIEGWENAREHIAADMTLLCHQHHGEATSGLFPKEKVIEANESPHNLRKGQSRPLLMHYEGNSCEIHIGSESFVTETKGHPAESLPLMVDGNPLIGFRLEEGHLFLYLQLFDQFNLPVINIYQNNLIYSASPWDIQFVGRTITIREESGKFLTRLTFEPPSKVTVDKGRFLYNGVEILVDSDYILLTNNNTYLKDNVYKNCHGGLVIGSLPKPICSAIRFRKINRYLGGHKESMAWVKSIKEEFG